YLDFFYQHTPLFAYLTASWMRIFGETWRSAHVFSALSTTACVAIIVVDVSERLRESRWRFAITSSVAVFVGLNFYVLCFATVGLPFGLGLLLSVGAFKLTVGCTRSAGVSQSFLAGVLAGAAVASSLLNIPILLMLAGWLASMKVSDRNKKFLSF